MPDSQNVLDFGRYRIQRLLGRGGMGEVYLARDTALERDVAIKFVSSQKLQDSAARARLLREAQAAAGLDHPCICPVHEAGVTDDGRAYIVMPFIDGTLLADVIPRGPMPPREALNLCSQIADALATAHHHGIVHRDLKPGNIILTAAGRPRLLDFGIAQTTIVPHVVAEATTVTGGPVTSGGLVGTPAYMSPEQVQHRQVDGRSDLFALGVVLYECLTGARAFDGPTPYEAVANVLRVDPPPPSTRAPGLDGRYDALCARLMAKDPNDRFQSAEEVVGAIRMLLPDTGRITGTGTQPIPPVPARTLSRRTAIAAILVAIVAASAFGFWRWTQATGLPPVPPDADQWYRRGTEALRDGAFQSARIALLRAVELFPQHALAYARLAEADAELDDDAAAQTHLLHLSSIVPDESALPREEQLRVKAVRALVLRDVDKSIALYKELAERHPDDAAAWVDLGRAQDASGLRDDARASFRRAVETDPQYAAAYLQLGSVEGAALHLDAAIDAFSRAEALFKTASNAEGRTEVLLRRGTMFDGANDPKRARVDTEGAIALATSADAPWQLTRGKLILASITATEGRFTDAVTMATDAVSVATTSGLDIVAADGLLDLSGALNDLGRADEAEVEARRALKLADDRGAKRTTARARLQLAEILRTKDQASESLALVNETLPYVQKAQYRQLELFGLLIAARSYRALGQLDQARKLSSEVLAVATALKDDGRIALAASDLAGLDTVLGRYPEALLLRQQAEAIYRRQGNQLALPYALANHADVLIRLGRARDADAPLAELEKGIAGGSEAYAGRARRLASLRAFQAVTLLNCSAALRFAAQAQPQPEPEDSASLLATGVAAYCEARSRGLAVASPSAKASADPSQVADRDYWLAAAALMIGDAANATTLAQAGLSALDAASNDETRWRLSALGAAAADAQHDRERADRFRAAARSSLASLEANWKSDYTMYVSRADLVDLKRRAALQR